MASKLIIFLVFAAVAQSSSAVTNDEFLSDLSKINKAGNSTLAKFYAVVNAVFDAIDDKVKNAGSNGEVIKQRAIDEFQGAFDTTVDGLRPIAKNTTVFKEVEVKSKDEIKKLVLIVWTLFDVTPASENSTATREEIANVKVEMSYQIGVVWNGIFNMVLNSVNSEVPAINMAIGELRPKATAFALKAGEAVAAAIEIWVTKLAPGRPEESSNHSEALQILKNLARASNSAEVNEKFSLFQYILTYNRVSDVSNVNNFTRLMNDEIAVAAGLWEVFGGALWFIDEENASTPSYETLNKTIYDGMQAAYYSTLDAFQTIPSHVKVEVKPDPRIPKLAGRITKAVELTGGEITTEISSQIEVVKQEVGTLSFEIWKDLYGVLGYVAFAENIEDAQPAILSAFTAATARMETAINYLFRALEKRASKDFPAEEGIKYSVGDEISTKFSVIRGCCLAAHLSNCGIKVPLSLVYNDQLGGPPMQE